MFRKEISQITLDIRMFPPPEKSCSTQYIFLDFLYVIEECRSFHLVYRLLLLQFVLGWAIFYHRSPGLLVRLQHYDYCYLAHLLLKHHLNMKLLTQFTASNEKYTLP